MEKLGALDGNFFYTETNNVLNHIASLQQFKLPEQTSAAEFVTGLKAFLLDRVHLVPYLTRKVRFIPGAFDHPVWVTDDQFDINNHIIETELPAPGDHNQLEQKIAELHAQPMDRSRPLWAIHVIRGLQDGQIAYYNQAHHACLDGMAGQAATMILMDNSPSGSSQDTAPEPAKTQPLESDNPTLFALFSHSIDNLIKFQLDAGTRLLGSLESSVNIAQRIIDPSKSLGALAKIAPQTRFNKAIGVDRTYACGKLSLTDVKQIGKSLDCKVNDVFMSISAGALRSYLDRIGELPQTSLIAGCPVSVRKKTDGPMGNSVTMMSVELATHIADPRIRLLQIKASANVAKEVTADLSEGYEPNISLPGLPALISSAARTMELTGLANAVPSPINVIISNIPGPRETLYSNGAEMLSHFPVSIPVHGLGVNLTVQSYRDHLYFGITACKKALPDAQILRDDLINAFNELKELVFPNNVTVMKNIPEALELKAHGQSEDLENIDKVA